MPGRRSRSPPRPPMDGSAGSKLAPGCPTPSGAGPKVGLEQEWLADRFEAHRARLRAVAYRMLGSLDDADDAVQDTWLRISRSGAGEVENLSGWLTSIVARVCLNQLRSRTTRREETLSGTSALVLAHTVSIGVLGTGGRFHGAEARGLSTVFRSVRRDYSHRTGREPSAMRALMVDPWYGVRGAGRDRRWPQDRSQTPWVDDLLAPQLLPDRSA
jgi:DNA-directed RNA polymerase specialized sigma24 family protein